MGIDFHEVQILQFLWGHRFHEKLHNLLVKVIWLCHEIIIASQTMKTETLKLNYHYGILLHRHSVRSKTGIIQESISSDWTCEMSCYSILYYNSHLLPESCIVAFVVGFLGNQYCVRSHFLCDLVEHVPCERTHKHTNRHTLGYCKKWFWETMVR